MKTWKKVASMLMAATMVGSIAACDGGNDDPPEEPLTNTQLATNYADTLNKTLEETKSLKITASVDVTATERYFGADGETFDETMTTVEKMAGDFELVLSQDAEGTYSVQMKAEMLQGEGEEQQTMVFEAIVVGQYAYTRDYIATENATTELWEKADMGVSLNIETLASQMLGMPWADIEYLFNANEFVQMQTSVNQALVSNLYAMLEAGQITNGAVNATLDITDDVEGWVEYINGIDETTKTVGAFIDETAAKLGMPISYATIVDEIARSGAKTVADMIDILDAFAEEQLGMTLQQLKDTLVNSDFAAKLMEKMQVPADEIAASKELKIADLKTQEFATMTVQQLFDSFMASQQPETTTTEEGDEVQPESAWTSFVATLDAMKTAKMADMGIMLPELPIDSVEEIAFTGGLQFNDKGTALTAFNFGAGINLNIAISESVENAGESVIVQTGVGNADIDFTLTVAEFSTTTVVITPPAADQIAADVQPE